MPKQQPISWKIMETFTPMVQNLAGNVKNLVNKPKRRGRLPKNNSFPQNIISRLLAKPNKKQKTNILSGLIANIGKTMDKIGHPGKFLGK